MTFAHDFRDRVIPMMRSEAKVQGLLLAMDQTGFGEARHEVEMIAVRAGLGLLPVDQQEKVTGHVPDLIWGAYEAGITTLRREERDRLRDPIAYYETVVSGCREPEKMRWALAAADPIYRKRLIAERANVRTR